MAFVKFLCCFLVISLAEAIVKRSYHGPPHLDPVAFATANSTPIWANIIQRVDNFNPTDDRTWQMRYLYNDVCFKSGGPIVIYLGGEWEIGPSRLQQGAVYDIACENNGYMFYTEHRFYGKSYPTNDFSTANLKYLSADQALGDLAYFVQYVKANNQQLANAKVVVIGGSYSATLATWARIKYPHLFDIAYASSAPVHAKANYIEYFQVVGSSIQQVSQTCYNSIHNGIAQIEQLLNTPQGVQNVSKLFNTCQTIITTDPERSNFFTTIAIMFASLVQYSRPGDIEFMCQQLANHTGSDVEKLGYYAGLYYTPNCVGSYADSVKDLSNVTLSEDTSRQWTYQTCTEYGWYQTSVSDNSLLGNTFSVDLFLQNCKDVYGQNFGDQLLAKAITRTNLFYGSDTPAVTRLITVHGSVDPWHPVGILKNLTSPQTVTYLVNGTSHCTDLAAFASATVEMKVVIRRVHDTITQWLKGL